MPIYSFRNKKTGEEFQKELKISERVNFLQENPDVIQLLTSPPNVADPVRMGVVKHPDSFKDLMKNIHKKAGSKSQIKT